jgi:hypothetical protein
MLEMWEHLRKVGQDHKSANPMQSRECMEITRINLLFETIESDGPEECINIDRIEMSDWTFHESNGNVIISFSYSSCSSSTSMNPAGKVQLKLIRHKIECRFSGLPEM